MRKKNRMFIKTLVTGGPDHLIYDIVETASGCRQDSSIYEISELKAYLKSRVDPMQICLGDTDSTFQSTVCLITQYRQQVGRCRRKKTVFNVSHSGERVEATEHIIWNLERQNKN